MARRWSCVECGEKSLWAKGWSWCYGFNPECDGVTCSSRCEDRFLKRAMRGDTNG